MLNTDHIAESHKNNIGMSELSALFGLNPFKNSVDMYLEKSPASEPKEPIEPRPVGDTAPLYWGLALEHEIARGFGEYMADYRGEPVKVRSDGREYRDEATRTVCHLDYRIVGEDSAVECKRPGSIWVGDWGEQMTDQIPPGYLIQCHGQMWRVKNLERVYVPRLVGHSLFVYCVDRNPGIFDLFEEKTRAFWDYVDREEVPPLEFEHARFDETIKRLYPGYNGELIELGATGQAYTEALETLSTDRLILEKAEKIYKRKIRALLGENSFGLLPDGKLWQRQATEIADELVPRKGFLKHRLAKTSKSKLPKAVQDEIKLLNPTH